jgi:hypothetical protein
MLLSEVSNTIFNPYKNTHFPLTPNQKMDRPLVQKEVFFFAWLERGIGKVMARREKHSRTERTSVRDRGEHSSNEAITFPIPLSSQASLAWGGIAALAAEGWGASRCSRNSRRRAWGFWGFYGPGFVWHVNLGGGIALLAWLSLNRR